MNKYIKQNTWLTLALFGLMIFPAQAASFDCAKAQSKVEHLICDSPETSKLDDELAASYKGMLHYPDETEAFNQAQMKWLKIRNSCSDEACVKRAYETRISALTQGYTLLMSKDVKLCNAVLSLYNEDMKIYKRIKYGQHEMFSIIKWQDDKELELTHAFFDINNDGKDELVIKYIGRLRGYDIDNLVIYPADSDVFSKLKPGAGGWRVLFDNPNHLFSSGNQIYTLKDLPKSPETAWIGGRFVLNPFIVDGTSYISMTDLTPRWIVIAKYKQAEEMQDICYFFNQNIGHQRY